MLLKLFEIILIFITAFTGVIVLPLFLFRLLGVLLGVI